MLGLSRTQDDRLDVNRTIRSMSCNVPGHEDRMVAHCERVQRDYFDLGTYDKEAHKLTVKPIKQCSECKETKPITDFSMDKNKKKDGLQAKCKECQSKYMKRYFATKIGIEARNKAVKRYLAKIA